MRKALLFGSLGQLGNELLRAPRPRGWDLEVAPIETFDFTRPHELEELVLAVRPSALLNAAAYTAVDKAESEPAIADCINALAPEALARAAARLDIPLFHVSTDYVFDGELVGREYVETDPVAPLSVYGRTKERGEALVRANCSKHVILRTSWVFSSFGTNFVKTMLRLGAERNELRIVDDQVGRPTHAAGLADAMLQALARITAGSTSFGTYHYAGNAPMSWRAFAEKVFDVAAKLGAKRPTVTPITTHEYPTAARRPKNSRLDGKLLAATFDIHQHDLDSALERCVQELMAEQR